ncbi:MJ1244 family protein [Methanopyrus sp.]
MKEVRLFVDPENVGRVMNAMADVGVTGFYAIEYRGVAPDQWAGFEIREDPESAIKAFNDLSEQAVMIVTVIPEEYVEKLKGAIAERLAGERYTVIVTDVEEIHVEYGR